MTVPRTVDEYLAEQPERAREVLTRIRAIVHEVVPGCTEQIKYKMPTFVLDDRSLLHLAGWQKHIAIYPTPGGEGAVQDRLAPFNSGKGSTRFPLTDPDAMDYELIAATVRLLAEQHRLTPS